MGASFVDRDLPWCDYATLKRQVAEISSQDAFENGSSYSGYWNMCSGLRIDESKVFESSNEAHDFLSETAEKWGPLVAVPFEQKQSIPRATLLADPAYKALQDDWQANYTAQRHHHPLIVRRTKEGKSAFKTCGACNSKINVKHLESTDCPVCRGNLLCTPTDDKRKAALVAKSQSLKTKMELREQAMLKNLHNGMAPPTKFWKIAGICAS